MSGLVILNIAGALMDSREVTNAEVWLKPLKFALSIGIYALTLAWLIGRLPSGSQTAAPGFRCSAGAPSQETCVSPTSSACRPPGATIVRAPA